MSDRDLLSLADSMFEARPQYASKDLCALGAFQERLTPGRWAELRPGPPSDDAADYGLPVWAGVVPIRTQIGAPEGDPRLAPGIARPDYLNRVRIG